VRKTSNSPAAGSARSSPFDLLGQPISGAILTSWPAVCNLVRAGISERVAMEMTGHKTSPVVELRFFAGLSIAETTDALGVSSATVERDWTVAKAWLLQRLSSPPEQGRSD
jgi:hypothetical protein